MRKYFNQKSVLFLFLVVNFKSVLASSPSSPDSESSPAPAAYRYHEVYDQVVRAVLLNDVDDVACLLEENEYVRSFNKHQKTLYGFTLRHIAHGAGMDRLLLSHGIALDEMRRTLAVTAEVYTACDGEEKVVCDYARRYESNPQSFNNFCKQCMRQAKTAASQAGQRATSFEKLATKSKAQARHFERLSSVVPGEDKKKLYKELRKKEVLKSFFFNLLAKKETNIELERRMLARKFYALANGFSYENHYDPRSLDARGFPPGHYSLAKRAEMAQSIRDGHFVMPVSEPLS